MWAAAMTINTVIWILLGIAVIYCFGTAILHGEWDRFVFVVMLWILSNFTEVVFAIRA